MSPDITLTKIRENTGITLIEIMVSILFFALIALSLSHTLSNSLYLTAQDNDIVNTNNLAQVYLNEVGENWQQQLDYDNPILPGIEDYASDSEYDLTDDRFTNNGEYSVVVYTSDLSTNDDGLVNLRRVRIKYFDLDDNPLSDLFLDFSRPGSYIVPGE